MQLIAAVTGGRSHTNITTAYLMQKLTNKSLEACIAHSNAEGTACKPHSKAKLLICLHITYAWQVDSLKAVKWTVSHFYVPVIAWFAIKGKQGHDL